MIKSALVLLSLLPITTFASSTCSYEISDAVNSIAQDNANILRSVYLGDANLNQVDGRRNSNLSTYSVLADVKGEGTLFLVVINTVSCETITAVEVAKRN